MESGSLKQALNELKSMLNTPMKAYTGQQPKKSDAEKQHNTIPEPDPIAEGDLPGQLVRVLGKGKDKKIS